jgi:hypothetical protein
MRFQSRSNAWHHRGSPVGARVIDESSGRSNVLEARQEIVLYILDASRIRARRLEHAWPRLSADILLFWQVSPRNAGALLVSEPIFCN